MNGIKLSRREFLKLTGAGLLGLALPGWITQPTQAAPANSLGRVAFRTLTIYAKPDVNSTSIDKRKRDDLLNLAAEVTGYDESAYNPIWYQLADGGYVYSGGVQPVKNRLQTPVDAIPKSGILGEVTVPFVDSYWAVGKNSRRGYRLYYQTTYWIRDVLTDKRDGSLWYRLYDDRIRRSYYVPAEAIRVNPLASPIGSLHNVPDIQKSLIVDLTAQRVIALEEQTVVFSARVSTGTRFHRTRRGSHITFHKRSTRHMIGGTGAGYYDLPGVPWVTYITTNGIAFHGTYWHNDYGKPRSQGCINLTSDHARWIYRWTSPDVPRDKYFAYRPGEGTSVYVFGEEPF